MLNSWVPYQELFVKSVSSWLESTIPDICKLVSKYGDDFNKVNFGEKFCELRKYKQEDIGDFVNTALDMNYLNYRKKVMAYKALEGWQYSHEFK
jgi:hypothetical protein